MQEITAALAAQHGALASLLDALDDEGWAAPSRCEGWSVGDVVLHLAQTDEIAIASATGTYAEAMARLTEGVDPVAGVDDGAAALVAAQRGATNEALHRRWRDTADQLRQSLAALDPRTRVQWVMGDMAARSLATTRLAECWIHTGDVRAAVGLAEEAPPHLRHIARLAWRTLPYAFASAGQELAGPVRFDLAAPDGSRWDLSPDEPALTTITGPALDLCLVAGQRAVAVDTALIGEGPDADAVLALVRTYA